MVIQMDFNIKVSTHPIVCYETESIYEVAKKMKQYDIGFIPVANKKKQIIGVMTDRDIVTRALSNQEKKSCKIQDYMTKHVYSIEKDKKITDAIEKMKKEKVTRLLVTDQKKLVGIISLFDLMKEKNAKLIFDVLKDIKRKETIVQIDTKIDDFYL